MKLRLGSKGGAMQFLGSITGWQWALAGAVPAGIIALYFLKLKRKPLEIPSTFLWKKSIEDLHVNSLFQRMRRSVLLLLQLLVAALALFALGRPVMDDMKTGRHLILAIDNSASMSATDVEPSRLEVAKGKALEVVDQMDRGDAAMVIAFSDSARVLCSYTENASVVKQAIRSIEPTARRTRFADALSIASGLANPQRQGDSGQLGATTLFPDAVPATVYLLSDGAFEPIDDESLGNLEVKYLAIGNSPRNVGLVSLSARWSESEPDRLEVFARARNFGAEPVEAAAELAVDGQVMDLLRLSIPAGSEKPMSFRLSSPGSAAVRVRLDVDDDFALDNVAWTVVNPPRRARVLIVGRENVVWKTVFSTRDLAELAEVTFAPASFADQDLETDGSIRDYDFVVFDGCSPRSMPPCNTLFVGSLPPTLAETEPTPVVRPILLNWDSGHPLLRFLRLDNVEVVDAFVVDPPRGADILIESDRGPLCFAVPRGVNTDVIQTFRLVADDGGWKTNWPLKPSFPLYVMNVVRSLGGIDAGSDGSLLPGEAITYRPEKPVDEAQLRDPSGKSDRLVLSNRGEFEYLDSERLGIYELDIDGAVRRFAVNLFDERESDIRPAEEIRVGAETAKDQLAEMVSRRELWKPLALFAFVLLVLEWYIYNRRVHL